MARPSESDKNNSTFFGSSTLVHLLQVYSKLYESSVNVRKLLLAAAEDSREPSDSDLPRRGRARQLRDAEIDTLVCRYREIRNMRQVAREFRMSRLTVAKLLEERGIDTSPGMKPSDLKMAVQMYEEGLSSMVIGKRLGFDNHTVLGELRKAGMTIRTASGRSPSWRAY